MKNMFVLSEVYIKSGLVNKTDKYENIWIKSLQRCN